MERERECVCVYVCEREREGVIAEGNIGGKGKNSRLSQYGFLFQFRCNSAKFASTRSALVLGKWAIEKETYE